MNPARPALLGRVLRARGHGDGAPAPVTEPRGPGRWSGVARLAPPMDVDGPRIRLGLVWAAVTTVAVVLGPLATSLAFAGTALGAGGQAARSWRRTSRRPYRPAAAGGAALCALAGSAGPGAVLAAAGVVVVAAVLAQVLRPGGRDWDARVTVAIAVLIGVGAATPAVMRDELGLAPTLVFVLAIHAVDASIFVVGSGAASRWEGPVAGAATAGVVGLGSAAVLVPPFRGVSPWVLAGAVAVLAPLGTYVATALLGRGEAQVPALRRLDAYLVAGPVWALLGHLLLDV